ncbi:MAG: 5-deoxy-glucuronate isomerase [Limisphaerales bacterium]
MKYTSESLIVRPANYLGDPDLFLAISPESAGWEHLSFQARRLAEGGSWRFDTRSHELVLVNLSGRFTVDSDRGRWTGFGGRSSVFAGAGSVLYLPRNTRFTITAEIAGEFAVAWTLTDEDHEPFLTVPEKVHTHIRGGDNASRQINDLLPPGSPVHKLVVVEVYTPSGNWSSYPPHKHDRHLVDSEGRLIEADLEEIYFYKIDRPEGCAFQWIYTDETSPLHKAGFPIDAVVRAGNDCAVLVPEGYHPVTSMPGYTTYYLNVLAGSAQSLANQDDPRFTWVKESYRSVDPRVPLY